MHEQFFSKKLVLSSFFYTVEVENDVETLDTSTDRTIRAVRQEPITDYRRKHSRDRKSPSTRAHKICRLYCLSMCFT